MFSLRYCVRGPTIIASTHSLHRVRRRTTPTARAPPVLSAPRPPY